MFHDYTVRQLNNALTEVNKSICLTEEIIAEFVAKDSGATREAYITLCAEEDERRMLLAEAEKRIDELKKRRAVRGA